MSAVLNFPWEAVNNRVAKVGVGAYLTASADTACTTAYTRMLGTFENEEISGFEIDATTSKLKYNPEDGVARTFMLIYAGEGSCPTNNDHYTVGVELTRDDSSAIVTGTENQVTCRSAGSPYPCMKVFLLPLQVDDLIEIQLKADGTKTVTMDEFSAVLVKVY